MPELYDFAVIGVLALLNIALLVANLVHLKAANAKEALYIKAVLARDVNEFALAEENPDQRIEREKLENELAEKAAKIEVERNRYLGIPVR
jgi:hypothetical protein